MKACAALFPSHTSFITLRNQGEIRDSHHLNSKEGCFNSIGREEKKNVALMYPWLPWFYCCLSWAADAIKVLGEKWLGKGCNCRRRQPHTGAGMYQEAGTDPKPSLLSNPFKAIWFTRVSLAMIGRPLNVHVHHILVFQLRFRASGLRYAIKKRPNVKLSVSRSMLDQAWLHLRNNEIWRRSCVHRRGEGKVEEREGGGKREK